MKAEPALFAPRMPRHAVARLETEPVPKQSCIRGPPPGAGRWCLALGCELTSVAIAASRLCARWKGVSCTCG
eukprot:6801007-Pyramimonas_sp.AAC.1